MAQIYYSFNSFKRYLVVFFFLTFQFTVKCSAGWNHEQSSSRFSMFKGFHSQGINLRKVNIHSADFFIAVVNHYLFILYSSKIYTFL